MLLLSFDLIPLRSSAIFKMHPCLEIHCVLENIISRLSLFHKVTLMSLVSVDWRKVVLACLSKQRSLAITEYQRPRSYTTQGFHAWNVCHEHTVSKNNLIRIRYYKLHTWKVMASWFPFLEYMYFDLCGCRDRHFDLYSHVFRLLVSKNAKTLKCVCVLAPTHSDNEAFPIIDTLPELEHWITHRISIKGMDNIIKACLKLEHLRFTSEFSEWHLLPKGMKYLGTPHDKVMGLDNILKSEFVSSLETLERVLITPAIFWMPLTFACLKRLEVVIEYATNRSLYNLSRILHNCPVLKILKIDICCFTIIQKKSWTNIINECRNVIYLKIFYSKGTERIDVSPWEDYVAELIESRMIKVETLDLDFGFSSKGLETLAKLEHLKSFSHFVYVRETVYEYIEDAKALLRFLRCHFAKNMTKYEMNFFSTYDVREELILPKSFLSAIKKMESEFSIKFESDYRLRYFTKDEPHPENFETLIYLTRLSANKVVT